LFFPPILLAVIGTFIAFDVWLFSMHGVAQSLRSAIYQPTTLLLLLGLVVFAAAFHEFGHATGSRYGGAPPGVMGFGIYIVWPAFYTDISESHRLGRGGRLRADLGGIYFHSIFILLLATTYFLTGFEPLLLAAVVLQVEVVRQLLPLIRFDGYYVLSDVIGVPDLFQRLKPILVSVIPWRKTDPKVLELKAWARVVVSIWVLLVIFVLGSYLVMITIAAPRIVATAFDSFFQHVDATRQAWSSGQTAKAVLSGIQVVVLTLPALGVAYTATMMIRRFVRGWRKLHGRPLARTALVVAALTIMGILAVVWWPDRDYRPIQPGESWTVQQTATAFVQAIQGRRSSALDGAGAVPRRSDRRSSPLGGPSPAATSGSAGVAGATGSSARTSGSTGVTGVTGVTGSSRTSGSTGSTGATSATGATSTSGSSGSSGSGGLAGTTGSQPTPSGTPSPSP
jgi:putative peptide zinc metalloprotease protein